MFVWAICATVWPRAAAAADTVILPPGLPVYGALYSQHHAVVVLRLDDRLMIYDPQASSLQAILLPEPTLSFSERDGDVIVGSEQGIYRVDVRRRTVTQRFDSPVPAHEVAFGDGYAVVQADGERDRVWWFPLSDGKDAALTSLRIENRTILRQGEAGPVLFNRWLSSVGFRHLAVQESGELGVQGCPQFYGARSQKVWLVRDHVFLDTGHKLDLTRKECSPSRRQELQFSTRLPVRQVADLCAGKGWIALVQQAVGLDTGSGAVADPGRHLDVIADPLPKRLGTFPLPSVHQDGEGLAWGRHLACDGPGRRVFVVLQDSWWDDGRGTWGISTFDITPLQDKIEQSKAWSKLLR